MKEFLLWDHDGVLVDTERWYYEATKAVLREAKIRLSQDAYLEYMAEGRSCWDLARASGASEAEVRGLRARRDALYQHCLKTEDIEIPGVREVVEELAAHYRMAIVTTSRREDFDLIHRCRDLRRHFEFVLTKGDYERSKPAPDPYLAAVSRFGARVRQAVAIEDSSRGLRSALAAGCDCVVIESAFTSSQDFRGASLVLGSVLELPGALGRMGGVA